MSNKQDNKQGLPSAVDDAASAQAQSAANQKPLSEEELLKKKLEALRKRDPFVYR